MAAKYQKQFEINRVELEIIETALREQAKQLSDEMLNQQVSPDNSEVDCSNQLTSKMRAVQSVLGNLHNQKIWFRPQDAVPLG